MLFTIHIGAVRCCRTSTLKVGDGVLAINGVELEDKNSEEVTRLLDGTDDRDERPTAVLTVCRTVAAAAAAVTSPIGN